MALRWQEQNLNQTSNPQQTPIPCPHRQAMGCLLRTDSHTSPSQTSYDMFIENRLPYLTSTDKLCDVYWEQTPTPRPHRQVMGCLLGTDSHTSPSQTCYGVFIENRLPYLTLTDKLWGVYWEQTPIPHLHRQAMWCLLRTDSHTSPSETSYGMSIENRLPYLALTDKLWDVYWEQTPIPGPQRQAMWCLLRTDSHTSPSQTSYGVFIEKRLPYLALTDKLCDVYWEHCHTSPSRTSYGVFIDNRLPYLALTDKLWGVYWYQTLIPRPHRQAMGCLLISDSHTSSPPPPPDKLWGVYWEQTPIPRPHRQAMLCLLITDSHTSPSHTSYGVFIENRLPYLALTESYGVFNWEQTPIPRPHRQAMWCLLRTDSHTSPSQTSYGVFIEKRLPYLTITDKLWGVYWEQTPIPRPHRQAMWCYSGNTWLCVHWQWNTREWCH